MLHLCPFVVRPERAYPISGIGEFLAGWLYRRLPERAQDPLLQAYTSLQHQGRQRIPRSQVSVYLSEEFERGERWREASERLKAHKSPVSLDQLRKVLEKSSPDGGVAFSVVTTCLNEGKKIEQWLDSIRAQTVQPSEVIICDGGSDDDTFDRMKGWAKRYREFPLFLLRVPKATIAQGRNGALEQVQNEVVLLSDVSAPPGPRWAESLLFPFLDDPTLAGVMGFVSLTGNRRAVLETVAPKLSELDPASLLPSTASLALKRSAWSGAGGFPEFISSPGSDTLFGYYLKAQFRRLAFVPEAEVTRGVSRSVLRSIAQSAQGDAEGGKLFWGHYSSLLHSAVMIGIEGAVALFFAGVALLLSWIFLIPVLILLVSIRFRFREVALRMAREAALLAEKPEVPPSSVVLSVALAQIRGFVRGLRGRGEVESKRLSSVAAGFVAVLVPTLPEFQGRDTVSRFVTERLSEGWQVLCLLVERRGVQAERVFDHPRYEEHLFSEFDLGVWARKHSRFITGKTFQVVDFSENLRGRFYAEEFRLLGAEPIPVGSSIERATA